MKNKLIMLLLVFIVTNSYGSKGRGGQYMFYGTEVISKIEKAQLNALSIINNIPNQILDKVFNRPVDRKKLAAIIENIKHSPTVFDRYRDGYPLVLDFIEEDGVKKIEILGRFYELVLYEKISGSIEKNLIHEALHFFGYDQDEAWETAGLLLKISRDESFKFCNKMVEFEPNGKCLFSSLDEHKDDLKKLRDDFNHWIYAKSKMTKKVYALGRHQSEGSYGKGVRSIYGFDLSKEYNLITIPFELSSYYPPKKVRGPWKLIIDENCYEKEGYCSSTVYTKQGYLPLSGYKYEWFRVSTIPLSILGFEYKKINSSYFPRNEDPKKVKSLDGYYKASFYLDSDEVIFIVE